MEELLRGLSRHTAALLDAIMEADPNVASLVIVEWQNVCKAQSIVEDLFTAKAEEVTG